MKRWRIALMLLLAAVLLLTACGSDSGTKKAPEESAAGAAELEVHFFDAGKADAILLTTENSTVLIDAGERGGGQGAGGVWREGASDARRRGNDLERRNQYTSRRKWLKRAVPLSRGTAFFITAWPARTT